MRQKILLFMLIFFIFLSFSTQLSAERILEFQKVEIYDASDNLKAYVYDIQNTTNMYLRTEVWMVFGKENSDGSITEVVRISLDSFLEFKPKEHKKQQFLINKNLKFDCYKFMYLIRVGYEPKTDV
jgi:hypothetical protein